MCKLLLADSPTPLYAHSYRDGFIFHLEITSSPNLQLFGILVYLLTTAVDNAQAVHPLIIYFYI